MGGTTIRDRTFFFANYQETIFRSVGEAIKSERCKSYRYLGDIEELNDRSCGALHASVLNIPVLWGVELVGPRIRKRCSKGVYSGAGETFEVVLAR